MYQPSERQHLQQIKHKIQNLLVGTARRQPPPPLVDYYNKLHDLHCKYKNPLRNNTRERDHKPESPADKTASHKQATGHAKQDPKSKSKSTNKKTVGLAKATDESRKSKSPLRIVNQTKQGKSVSNKQRPLSRKPQRQEDRTRQPQMRDKFKQTLEQVKKRYVALTTLSMRNQRSTGSLHYDPKERQSEEDADQMKKQLEEELQRYTSAIKQGQLDEQQRYQALLYLDEIMDKFEFLLS